MRKLDDGDGTLLLVAVTIATAFLQVVLILCGY